MSKPNRTYCSFNVATNPADANRSLARTSPDKRCSRKTNSITRVYFFPSSMRCKTLLRSVACHTWSVFFSVVIAKKV